LLHVPSFVAYTPPETLLFLMRELKFHEQKLLKKVNFLQWKSDQNVREIQVLRRYHVQNRDDYVKYSKVAGQVRRECCRRPCFAPDADLCTRGADHKAGREA